MLLSTLLMLLLRQHCAGLRVILSHCQCRHILPRCLCLPSATSALLLSIAVPPLLFIYSHSLSLWPVASGSENAHRRHTCSSGALLLQQQPQPSASTDERLRITQQQQWQHRPLLQASLKSGCCLSDYLSPLSHSSDSVRGQLRA